jgi:hypothetical protein
MKRLAIVLLLSLPASAGTYSVVTTAAQDVILERARQDYNGKECSRLALATNCTLAQAQAKDAATTYCNDILSFVILSVKNQVQGQKEVQTAQDAGTFCSTWKGLSAGAQATACSQLGLPSGCTPCP